MRTAVGGAPPVKCVEAGVGCAGCRSQTCARSRSRGRGTRSRSSRSTSERAYCALRPLCVPMNRRNCRSTPRSRCSKLLLEGAEGPQVALDVQDFLHGVSAEAADQLVLQVRDTDVEAELLHVRVGEVGARAGPLQNTAEVVLLPRVAQTGDGDVEPVRAAHGEESPDAHRAAQRQHRDALLVEAAPAPPRQCLDGDQVALPLDQDDLAHTGRDGQLAGRLCGLLVVTSVRRPRSGRPAEPSHLVHTPSFAGPGVSASS